MNFARRRVSKNEESPLRFVHRARVLSHAYAHTHTYIEGERSICKSTRNRISIRRAPLCDNICLLNAADKIRRIQDRRFFPGRNERAFLIASRFSEERNMSRVKTTRRGRWPTNGTNPSRWRRRRYLLAAPFIILIHDF